MKLYELMPKLPAVSLLLAAALCSTVTVANSNDHSDSSFKVIGQGQYSYWFWDLYQARLFSSDGRFVDYQQSVPLKLELTYQRDIKKQDFIDATMQQWKIQQGALDKKHKLWAGELGTLWRDVSKGDTLTAVLRQDGLVDFYFNNNLLGRTSDPAFGSAFFDIWLSEKTTAPELRSQLLALGQDNTSG